jgi:N-[(2S)-2-amino-2-carboxyethyl]-L-glutamate dehydrogenase
VEPLLYLTSAEVVDLCRRIDPIDVVTDAFRAVCAGTAAVAPEAALRWTAPDGTPARSLMLPAHYGDAYGTKLINACVGNISRGLPRAHGLITLFDPETAAPRCLMDAGHVSALRTAAVSVAALGAVRDLGTVERVAFLGCGRQAATHLDVLLTRGTSPPSATNQLLTSPPSATNQLLTSPPSATNQLFQPTEVTVYDADPARGAAFADTARRLIPAATVRVVHTPEEAVRAGDVVVAATTTTTPYVPLEWTRPGSVFLNVSLDDATEELLLGCDHLFVDDWALIAEDRTRLLGRLASAGRVTGPGDETGPSARRVDADLPTLLSGGYGRPIAPTDRTVINPFGMGVHDIAIAARIHAAATHEGVGTALSR